MQLLEILRQSSWSLHPIVLPHYKPIIHFSQRCNASFRSIIARTSLSMQGRRMFKLARIEQEQLFVDGS